MQVTKFLTELDKYLLMFIFDFKGYLNSCIFIYLQNLTEPNWKYLFHAHMVILKTNPLIHLPTITPPVYR